MFISPSIVGTSYSRARYDQLGLAIRFLSLQSNFIRHDQFQIG